MSLEEAIKGIKFMLEHNDLTVYEQRLLTKVLEMLQMVYAIATEK